MRAIPSITPMPAHLEYAAAGGELAPVEYRAISSAAVSSLALGVLSALALFDWWMLVLPVAAIAFGGFALWQIGRRGDELAGKPLAEIGVSLGVLFFLAAVPLHAYIYATEVPEGYERISYDPLQPAPGESGIPLSAHALDGKRVFVKGYILQGMHDEGIRTFLLVRDQGDCCFGGNPTISERIQVTLSDPDGITYSPRLRKVAGVFRVRPLPNAVNGPGGVYYHLDEAMLR